MITLSASMSGATINFPEAVVATLGGQLVIFDYTPDQAGSSGPGPGYEGYLPRDPQFAGLYEIFGYMPDDWYFFDGNTYDWWSDCTLINNVDGAAGFIIHGIAFQPETMPVVRAGGGCRPSVRIVERALSHAAMFAPNPNRSHAVSAVRLAVDRPILRHAMPARFDSVPPTPTGFSNPTLDSLQSNLVCVWKLEEGAGKRIDAISGEDLSAHNAPSSVVGKSGQACSFSNAAANGLYRDLPRLGPLGAHEADTEITFSTWLYANSVGDRSIAGFIDEMGGMGPWSLSLGYQNRITLNINTYNWNDYAYAQTGSISTGQWYNIVFTFSQTGHLRLYVNGGLAGTGDTYGGNGGLAEPYTSFTLGCGLVYDYENDTTGFGNTWDGLIDETCLWNKVPDDPDAFAAALWNGSRGVFYRIDTTRRTASGIATTARQPMDILRRERFGTAANLVQAGTNTRFDAVARSIRARPALRSSARASNGHRQADAFDFVFGLNPTRAAFAYRTMVRRTVLASAATNTHAAARQSAIATFSNPLAALMDSRQTGTATSIRPHAIRYIVVTHTVVLPNARARHLALRVGRADADFIVVLTRVLSAVRAGIQRDMNAVNCASTVFGLAVRSTTTTVGAAYLKALVELLYAGHGVRIEAGMRATFTSSGEKFDVRAVNRVATRDHSSARNLLVWTSPHVTSARDTTGKRTPFLYLARARHDVLNPVRLNMRAHQRIAMPARHEAFTQAGWRLIARNAATGEELDLGFVPAADGGGEIKVEVELPDGVWQIEPRPAEWFWTDCQGRAAFSVNIRDGHILHAGLPAILNLRGEILNQRRVVRWEIAAELLPQTFQFAIWTSATSPVDTTGQPLATVPLSAGRGSYLHAFMQSEPLHLAVAAFDAEGMGPKAEIFLDWSPAAAASPTNQLPR